MRFKPQVVRPEEPPLDSEGELLLPPELASLAARLSAEAAELGAVCRPADQRAAQTEATSVVPHSSRWRGFSRWSALAGSLLLAAAIGGLLATRPEAPNVAREPTPSPARPVPAEVTSTLRPTHEPVTSPVMLHEWTSPELEALLDLMEQEPGRAGDTISI